MDNSANVFGFSATACCRDLYFKLWFIWICFECRRFSITSKLALWCNVDLFWRPCRTVHTATKELLPKTRATRTYKLHWAVQDSLKNFQNTTTAVHTLYASESYYSFLSYRQQNRLPECATDLPEWGITSSVRVQGSIQSDGLSSRFLSKFIRWTACNRAFDNLNHAALHELKAMGMRGRQVHQSEVIHIQHRYHEQKLT